MTINAKYYAYEGATPVDLEVETLDIEAQGVAGSSTLDGSDLQILNDGVFSENTAELRSIAVYGGGSNTFQSYFLDSNVSLISMPSYQVNGGDEFDALCDEYPTHVIKYNGSIDLPAGVSLVGVTKLAGVGADATIQAGGIIEMGDCKIRINQYGVRAFTLEFTQNENDYTGLENTLDYVYSSWNETVENLILVSFGGLLAFAKYTTNRTRDPNTFVDTYTFSLTFYAIKSNDKENYFNIPSFYSIITGEVPPTPPTPEPPDPSGDVEWEGVITDPTPYGTDYVEPSTEVGTFDYTSDTIDEPVLTSSSVFTDGSGGILLLDDASHRKNIVDHLYDPSIAQMLFSDIQKFMNGVLSYKRFPFKTGAQQYGLITDLAIGGYTVVDNLSGDDRIPFTSQQYITLNFGTIDFSDRLTATFIDYEPYTKFIIHLPWVGEYPIEASEVWGNKITVKYKIDIVTGDCVAMIKSSHKPYGVISEYDVTDVIYQYTGNVGDDVMLFARGDNINMQKGLSTYVAGATAMLAGAVTGMTGVGAVSGAALAGGGLAMLSGTHSMMESGNTIRHTGQLSSNTALNGNNCYIRLETVDMVTVKEFSAHFGYTSDITRKLKKVAGFNKVRAVHLENITALDSELREINEILASGVIIEEAST